MHRNGFRASADQQTVGYIVLEWYTILRIIPHTSFPMPKLEINCLMLSTSGNSSRLGSSYYWPGNEKKIAREGKARATSCHAILWESQLPLRPSSPRKGSRCVRRDVRMYTGIHIHRGRGPLVFYIYIEGGLRYSTQAMPKNRVSIDLRSATRSTIYLVCVFSVPAPHDPATVGLALRVYEYVAFCQPVG